MADPKLSETLLGEIGTHAQEEELPMPTFASCLKGFLIAAAIVALFILVANAGWLVSLL